MVLNGCNGSKWAWCSLPPTLLAAQAALNERCLEGMAAGVVGPQNARGCMCGRVMPGWDKYVGHHQSCDVPVLARGVTQLHWHNADDCCVSRAFEDSVNSFHWQALHLQPGCSQCWSESCVCCRPAEKAKVLTSS